jgi:class 3 adenylate cyclase
MNPTQIRGNRTFICSVVFIDIVEYTRKAVTEQMQLKERLNALLAEALKDVAANDRIILDTGDGAAISFVGDPEDALFVCLSLRHAIAEAAPGDPAVLTMRIGINLGPVKLIRDLNGQPNIIGDGINVAQRIMGFAEPAQILVSRSYFEVVSCLSETYAKLFHYEGSRTDKHVREHEVYALGDGTGEVQRSMEAAHHAATTGKHTAAGAKQAVVDQLSSRTIRLKENLRTKPKISTALAVVAILVIAIGVRGLREPPATQAQAPAPAPAPAVKAPVIAKSTAPAVEPKAAAVPAPVPAPKEKAAGPTARERAAAAAAAKEKAAKQAAAARPSVPTAAPTLTPAAAGEAVEPGLLAFAITPWGEVYVDGKKLGVSPPLQEIQIGAGPHRIEIKNTTFPPHVQTVEVKTGERIRIRHLFR